MLVSDLLHSCANELVAEAAVRSIGGAFAAKVEVCAIDGGVDVGAFTSRIVREFALGATERDWRDLHMILRGHDHPLLAGFELIVSRRLRTRAFVARRDTMAPLEVLPSLVAAAAA